MLEWFTFPHFNWDYVKKLPINCDELILKTIKNWNYQLYEHVTGIKLKPGESHRKDEDSKKAA